MTCTSTTVIGNITADPELCHLPSGAPAVTFTIATNERHFNPHTRRFSDGPTVYLRCNLTGPGADNAAAGLPRGTRVIAHGTLAQRSCPDRHGRTHFVTELHVQEIGPTIRYTRVHLAPAARTDGDPDQATVAHDPTPAAVGCHDNACPAADIGLDASRAVDLDAAPDNAPGRVNQAYR